MALLHRLSLLFIDMPNQVGYIWEAYLIQRGKKENESGTCYR